MVRAKKSSKKVPAKKAGKLVQLSSLSKSEIAKVNLNNLWLMKPGPAVVQGRMPRARYCRCRNVCIV